MKLIKANGMLAGRDGKVYKQIETQPNDYMPHYREIVMPDGKPIVIDGKVVMEYKPYVYNDATVWSMINPQPYVPGYYPYGYCVTLDNVTYQVSNILGTENDLASDDWNDIGTDAYFVPVSTHQDLYSVRSASTRIWGQGTPFENTYPGQGVYGNYIQVSDIDLYDECRLGGAYYSSGKGWYPSDIKGIYNQGGRIIRGLYINRTSSSVGLFYENYGVFENAYIIDVEIHSNRAAGAIAAYNSGTIRNCITTGIIAALVYDDSYSLRARGGIVGANFNRVINCYSAVLNTAQDDEFKIGGCVGYNMDSSQVAQIINCYSLGHNASDNSSSGGLVGAERGGTITASYYNSETSGQSDTGKGTPKTTAEMLSGLPSPEIFTNWDPNVWGFQEGCLPYLKIYGITPVNLPPPDLDNPSIEINGDDITINWQQPNLKPLGYNLYVAKDNLAWEKLNQNPIHAHTYTYTVEQVGVYKYFVTAIYHRRYTGETGNSIVTTTERIVGVYRSHVTRVINDGGSVGNEGYGRSIIELVTSNNLYYDTLLLFSPDLGMITRSATVSTTPVSYIEKGHSACLAEPIYLDEVDLNQSTLDSQPIICGNIAPTERLALKNPANKSLHLSHSFVSINSSSPWSFTVVLNWNGNVQSSVNFIDYLTQFGLMINSNFNFHLKTGSTEKIFPGDNRVIIGKNSIITYAYSEGEYKLYLNGQLFSSLSSPAQSTYFLALLSSSLQSAFAGTIHYYRLQIGAMNAQQIENEHNALRSLIPEYDHVQIGNQLWTTSNYEAVTTVQGDVIPEVQDSATWADATNLYDTAIAGGATEKEALHAAAMWCYYDNNPDIGAIYGKLYNWYAVKLIDMALEAEGSTWRVPTDADFNTLSTELGGTEIAGGKMKVTGTDYWSVESSGANNESGISEIGAGTRTASGSFSNYKLQTIKHGINDRYRLSRDVDTLHIFGFLGNKMEGFSLRLVKNLT